MKGLAPFEGMEVSHVRRDLGVRARAIGAAGHTQHRVAPEAGVELLLRRGHVEMVHALRAAGADPRVRDSKHESDTIGWAEASGATRSARSSARPLLATRASLF